ncbi:DUF3991 and TOPRIM domain-containing protein [Ensifer sp. YR511]|uniref:DUF3991 and TOPRIM domain-containing protein n=1 Tax=Ensifer sp. YR511 TaxID=1855294 RepID=UPI00088AE2B9|nr:DUF3991 and TOPRIM domain-containing protein [Ensifer sp. YR511]SDN38304.1 Toprim-like [Ensifer sp. YR511]
MERHDIEMLREKVSCVVVLEQAGFQIDLKGSTRRAVKYRSGSDIIIVTHAGRGWFDPLSDRKGDVFALVGWLKPADFPAKVKAVGAHVGVQPSCLPIWTALSPRTNHGAIPERWSAKSLLRTGTPAYRYLADARAIPRAILGQAIRARLIRQGPFGSAWFAHENDAGQICGWEERGPEWRGFSSSGNKILFRFGKRSSRRLCVTEAAIDALSLAAIEGERRDTLYTSTAGGWSPATEEVVRKLAGGVGLLVAATDRNSQGEAYADMLRQIAIRQDCGFQRLRPLRGDWNEDLKERNGG